MTGIETAYLGLVIAAAVIFMMAPGGGYIVDQPTLNQRDGERSS